MGRLFLFMMIFCKMHGDTFNAYAQRYYFFAKGSIFFSLGLCYAF